MRIIYTIGIMICCGLSSTGVQAQGLLRIVTWQTKSDLPACDFQAAPTISRPNDRGLRLEQSMRRSLVRLQAAHGKLIVLYPELKQRIDFAQSAYVDRTPGTQRVFRKNFFSLFYDDRGKIDCILVDSRTSPQTRSEPAVRRIIRVKPGPGGLSFELESRTGENHSRTPGRLFSPASRHKLFSRLERYLNDMANVSESVLAREAEILRREKPVRDLAPVRPGR